MKFNDYPFVKDTEENSFLVDLELLQSYRVTVTDGSAPVSTIGAILIPHEDKMLLIGGSPGLQKTHFLRERI